MPEDKKRFCFWLPTEAMQKFNARAPFGSRDAIYKTFLEKVLALSDTKNRPDHMMLDIAKGNYDIVLRQSEGESYE